MEGCNNQLNLLMRSSDLYAGAYNGLEDKLAPSSAQLHLWHTELYDCFTFAKETADSGIMFPPVQPNRASTIVTSDASWASARCHKSQFGLVVTICSAQVTETRCNYFILDWKTGRSPRVCRSTLAPEVCACDEASDRACYTNLVLSELLYQKAAFHGDLRLNSFLCTGAKILFDCLIAENPVVSDKRSMVQIRST